LLFRLCNLQPGQEITALNDAIVYLHAMANGQTVLTRNLRDFDVMNQVLPNGRVLFYERTD
jgi:predicted nucleic acid-binding protein